MACTLEACAERAAALCVLGCRSGFALAPVASQGSFTRGVHRIKSVLAYMNRPPEGVLPEVGSAEGQQMWVYGLTGERVQPAVRGHVSSSLARVPSLESPRRGGG